MKSLLLTFFSLFSLYAHAEMSSDLSAIRDLLKSGKVAEASALIQKELHEHPKNEEAHQLLGHIYLLEGNEVKASEEFNKAASIDQSYREKILSEYYEGGLILLKDPKKSNVGLHYLNKYLLENKDKGMEVASILHREGLNLITANRFMAHILLERAKELNPSYEKDEAFYFAYTVRSAHKSAEMVKGGEDFLSKFPASHHVPEVLYRIGEAYFDLRKPHEARGYFKRLVNEFPETGWGKKGAQKLK